MLEKKTAEYRKIAVLRALKLGDLLCAVPALRALRLAYPQPRITLVGLPWSSEFKSCFSHLLDDFIEFPGYPGLPEQPLQPRAFSAFLERVQAESFDLALQMHGAGTYVNECLMLWGAAATGGFYTPGFFQPPGENWLPYPQNLPEVWRHLRLMERLGVELHGSALEFPLRLEDRMRLNVLLGGRGARVYGYVCIHPGAISAPVWNERTFAELARALFSMGFSVVLTGGAAEAPLCERVREMAGCPVISLAGRTDLALLGALIAHSRLLVCPDTGVSHLAAACRTPSVVIFQKPEGEGWPPLNRVLHRFVTAYGGVTLPRVLEEINDLLRYTATLPRFSQPLESGARSESFNVDSLLGTVREAHRG